MKMPIIIIEHGDVFMFESVEKAEMALEATDVKNGEYVAYDGNGCPLALTVVKKERPSSFFGKWIIDGVEISEITNKIDNHASELRRELNGFLKRTNNYEDRCESLSLSDLINKFICCYGYDE
jgi:hypothetical protein